ncbi:nitrile hydratase [Streptomyces sp. NBC_00687]|uniref:nitrile hydratase n=1 Tax=Streptomyces sp. NBC_00687 TaxID=2975807 RepID=UPI002255E8F0|nr:nitrile hydratase [Streptomyces sp. NBC_00687]MCX4918926.1 nitrile hydratase [Streptomyces sp. NBC_00687]
MRDAADQNADADGPSSLDLEQALTMLAWSDPSITENDGAAPTRLGIDVPSGLRFDVRVQRSDTLYLVIPPVSSEEAGDEHVVDQMDLWRSGDQFVWILPQDAKTALLEMREQYRNRSGEERR